MKAQACQQIGCDGTIEQGFCNRCGLEPANGKPQAMPPLIRSTSVLTGRARFSHALSRAGTLKYGSRESASGDPGSAIASASTSLTGRSGVGSRRGTATSRSTSRKHLGLGLVTVPGLPPLDPERSVLADPKVPEHKRFCGNGDCHDVAGNPTPLNRRLNGHCPQCGKWYSFLPSLKSGDVIGGQYEVKGCLAYGGLGWIYLAKDITLNRWAVLKGLLNVGDESAAAAAIAERQFLASVKHANIVGIYNSVTHGGEAFIVMEYIAGTTLKDLRKGRGPLPPGEAIAYIHRILGAFAYLHSRSMVYCDFKPDNVMLEGDPPDVKLIDMGGVRMIDDTAGDIYGTRGYSAPEAAEGPTIVSDLYTVGRTLAVLLMDFRFQSVCETTLPPPGEQPVLATCESLYRFLLRATAENPARRFQSADEMSEQLGGVLREVVAGSVPPRPVESEIFGGDVLALRGSVPHRDSADGETAAPIGPAAAEFLPQLKVDADDPGANFVLSLATVPLLESRASVLRENLKRLVHSVEVRLRLADTLIDLLEFEEAWKVLAEVEESDPFDWRVLWYRGVWHLTRGEPVQAVEQFDQVYAELPGEPVPKLALALSAEAAGDTPTAARLYDLVSSADPNFVTASFGLARCLAREGRRADAVTSWRRVPQTSSLYICAQLSLARCLIGAPSPGSGQDPVDLPQVGTGPGAAQFCEASEVIDALPLNGAERARAHVDVLSAALGALLARTVRADLTLRVLGGPLTERAVRRGLEQSLRHLARFEADRDAQIALIDRANSVRPRSWM